MDSSNQNITNRENEGAPSYPSQDHWMPQVIPHGLADRTADANANHYHVFPPAGQPSGGNHDGQDNHQVNQPSSQQPIGHQPFDQSQAAHPPVGQYYGRQRVNNNFRRLPQSVNASGPGHAASTSAFPPRRFPLQNNRQVRHLPGTEMIDPNFAFSPNYQGNRNAPDNHSVNIPDDHNCSVFIRCLPPNCNPHTLLQKIRGCGSKVFALFVNSPDYNNPRHCAAKLVFFNRCGVDWLFSEIRAGRFNMVEDGRLYQPNACYNKIRVAAQPLEDERSRVVIVAGPPSVVNGTTLNNLFQASFYFEIDCIFDHHAAADWSVMQIHFSSARCQGENAIQVLRAQTARPAASFAP
ncbi:hypothetical protein PGQ11_005439 [Apiospora arundinis]|uniref:RRM domain-containing protein n=1 Tax=Apiospora arundinis TaxID=335852 RepID=A0ABR2JAT8_9PEZI